MKNLMILFALMVVYLSGCAGNQVEISSSDEEGSIYEILKGFDMIYTGGGTTRVKFEKISNPRDKIMDIEIYYDINTTTGILDLRYKMLNKTDNYKFHFNENNLSLLRPSLDLETGERWNPLDVSEEIFKDLIFYEYYRADICDDNSFTISSMGGYVIIGKLLRLDDAEIQTFILHTDPGISMENIGSHINAGISIEKIKETNTDDAGLSKNSSGEEALNDDKVSNEKG